MTRQEHDMISQLAQDIGYIRGQIDILVDARLPDRMTFVEGQQKVQNQRPSRVEGLPDRVLKYTLLMVPAISGIAAVAASFVFHL